MTLTTLRRALEEANIKDEAVIIKGPLSDAFTKSLNDLYSKAPKEGEDNVATESQANDAIAMQTLAKAIQDELNPPEPNSPIVFAVDSLNVNNNDVMALTQDMIDQDPNSELNYALVIDTTQESVQAGTGEAPEKFVDLGEVNPLSSALESIAKAHGVKVYRSLEAYAQDRYQR